MLRRIQGVQPACRGLAPTTGARCRVTARSCRPCAAPHRLLIQSHKILQPRYVQAFSLPTLDAASLFAWLICSAVCCLLFSVLPSRSLSRFPPVAQASVKQLRSQLYLIRSGLSAPNFDAFVVGELSAAVRAAAAETEQPQKLLEALGDLILNNAAVRFNYWQQLVTAAGAGMAGRLRVGTSPWQQASRWVGLSVSCILFLQFHSFILILNVFDPVAATCLLLSRTALLRWHRVKNGPIQSAHSISAATIVHHDFFAFLTQVQTYEKLTVALRASHSSEIDALKAAHRLQRWHYGDKRPPIRPLKATHLEAN